MKRDTLNCSFNIYVITKISVIELIQNIYRILGKPQSAFIKPNYNPNVNQIIRKKGQNNIYSDINLLPSTVKIINIYRRTVISTFS